MYEVWRPVVDVTRYYWNSYYVFDFPVILFTFPLDSLLTLSVPFPVGPDTWTKVDDYYRSLLETGLYSRP